MTRTVCDQVQDYADGELSAQEAARFRDHLGGCERCQRAFESALQFSVLGHEAGKVRVPATSATRTARLRRRIAAIPPWQRWMFSGCALAAGVGVILVLARPVGPGLDELSQWQGQSPTRAAEERFALADGWRPYATTDGAAATAGDAEQRATLAAIELAGRLTTRGDWARLATLYLARHKPDDADPILPRLDTSPESENLRGAAALMHRRYDEALEHLDKALADRPGFPQALWNRGLALEALHMPLSAVEAFRASAAGSPPAWRNEAEERAQKLSAAVERQRATWKELREAAHKMVAGGEMPPRALLLEHPDIVRHSFYPAVRGASSPEVLRKLRAVAEALDAVAGSGLQRALVDRLAKAPPEVRTQLATRYAAARKSRDVEAAMEPLIEAARSAHQPDILFGVLEQAKATLARSDEMRALARATGDPWLLSVADAKEVEALVGAGRLREAQRRLQGALADCRASGDMTYRCLHLQHEAAQLHAFLYEPDKARDAARAEFEAAWQASTKKFAMWAIEDLAAAASLQRRFALAYAYIREVQRWEPNECTTNGWVQLQTADLLAAEGRFAEARARLSASVAPCPPMLDIAAAELWADLNRVEPNPREIELARAILRDSRKAGLRDDQDALSDAVEGRLLMAGDRPAALRLLDRAIAKVDGMRHPEGQAREARALAFATRIDQDVADGRFDLALAGFAREIGAEAPARCAVGLSQDAAAIVSVVRGEDGRDDGHREAHAITDPPPRLAPSQLARLTGCRTVDVFGRGTILGQAAVLPSSLAWRYRIGAVGAATAAQGPQTRVVVSNVSAPLDLGLPPPVPAPATTDARRPPTTLTREEATPPAVLAAMKRAGVIELYVHGAIDPEISDSAHIVLAPGPDGRFVLTADEIADNHLDGAPIVFLAACRAATQSRTRRSTHSLPAAFIRAGARAVFASPEDVRSDQIGPLFEEIRRRMEAGEPAALALREARLKQAGESIQSVVLFE